MIIFLDNLLTELLHLNQNDDQLEVERRIETLVRSEMMSVRTVIFKSSGMKDKGRIPQASEKQKRNINPSKFLTF